MMKNSGQSKISLAVAAIAIVTCLVVVTGAGARVIPNVSTSFTDPTLGAHSDYVVDVGFGYGATGMVGPTGELIEDPATYPGGADFRENVLNVVVDSPPGLVGNPNAVPFAERCDVATFDTAVCPDSSVVGTIEVTSTLLPMGADEGGPTAPVVPGADYIQLSVHPYNPASPPGPFDGYSKLTVLKSTPEIPTTIGIFVQPPFGLKPIRQRLVIAPDPNGQLRMRSVTSGIDNALRNNANVKAANLRIDRQTLRFYGVLANGHAFMTNPTTCEKWQTSVYANARDTNDNLDSDPLGSGAPAYAAGNTDAVTPDCTNFANLPFPMSGKVTLSTPTRDTSPAFDFAIENPGVMADGQVSATPKKVVTTIPASINVDVNQLGRVCSVASFNADTCPPLSRVGSVRIELPIVVDGLAGDVYLVKQSSNSGLPDLGLRLRGAFGFTQIAQNRFVGSKFNQIETTFDNIPPAGFTSLKFHLDGGPNGLLCTLKCPTYNKAPAVPNFTYTFTSWMGISNSTTTPLNMANCFGIQTLKPYKKCLNNRLVVRPNYQSRTRVKSVTLKVDKRTKARSKHTPYRFDLQLKKLKLKKKKKHTLELRAAYDDGTISKKITTFKVCR